MNTLIKQILSPLIFLISLHAYFNSSAQTKNDAPELINCYCTIHDPLRINTGMKAIVYHGKTTRAKCDLICNSGCKNGNGDLCSMVW